MTREDTLETTATAPEEAPGLRAGPTRLGEFTLLEKLGAGGMGAVYLAVQASLRRKVALKVIRVDGDDEELCRRLESEARLLATLHHRHVVQVLTAGRDAATGRLYFAMEYVPGESLEAAIERGPLPFGRIVAILRALTLALEHAWDEARLVHRDVKPGNVMLGASGAIKLLDFGLARSVQAVTRLTAEGMTLGTPEYMSPEQGAGADVDFRTDMYSLGVLLHRMLAGSLPFTAPTIAGMLFLHNYARPRRVHHYRPTLPGAFQPLLRRLLAKRPERRYASHTALLAALDAVEAELVASGREDALPGGAAVPPRSFEEARDQVDAGDLLELGPVVRLRQPLRHGRLAALAVAMLVALGVLAWQPTSWRMARDATGAAPAAAPETPPAAPVVEPAPPPRWGPARPVWRTDEVIASGDGSVWGFDPLSDHPDVLIGGGMGALRREVSGGSFRLEGSLVDFGAAELGIYLTGPHGLGLGVNFQDFGAGYLQALECWKPDGRRERKPPAASALRDGRLDFTVTVAAGRAQIVLGDSPLVDGAIGHEVTGFALYVHGPAGGKAGYRVRLAIPR